MRRHLFPPRTTGRTPLVLLVSESPAITAGVSRRLGELAAIALWPASRAPEGARLESYDVLIVCPYVSQLKRERLRELLVAAAGEVGVIELQDRPGAGEVDVVRPPRRGMTAFPAIVSALSSA